MTAKINGEWDIIPSELFQSEGDDWNFIDVEEAQLTGEPGVARIRSRCVKPSFADIGPFVYLSLQDSRRLRAYLKMCEENHITRSKN